MTSAGADGDSGLGRRRESARRERSPAWRERRDEILRAAAELFRVRGFHGTNITDIAQRLAVNQSSVYYYFGRKEQILLELVENVVESHVAGAEAAAAGSGPAADRLASVVQSLATSYDRDFPVMQLYVQEDVRRLAGSEAERYFLACSDRFEAAVHDLVAQGVRSGEFARDLDPRMATLGVLGMVNWMHRWFTPDGGWSGAEIGRQFGRMILGGLSADQHVPEFPTSD